METEGTKIIFARSTKSQMRYTQLYRDGNSKFIAVENIYKGIKVVKRECIGHVQKRVGTHLRKLKKETKEIGAKGKLTNAIIGKLQKYYGLAIIQHVSDKQAMKKAIISGFCHVASYKIKNHVNCQTGKNSWCRYQRAVASNEVDKFRHGPCLPTNIALRVGKVINELTCDSLLDKCLHGKTQNQNESFVNMIWERLPKSTFVGLQQLSLGIYDGVSNFNI